MRLIRRLLLGLLSVLILLALAAWLWLRSTVPQDNGTVALAPLVDSVQVRFDSLGVPTIRARSEADLYRALGYLHARDRFWQMDLMRRAAEGRLSELFGARAVAADRDARDWELGWLAQRAWAATAPADRELLVAYASGVNAWLGRGGTSLEHRLLRLVAEPWRAEDSYAILLLEAKQLHNLGDERIRANAVRLYGPGADSLMAPGWPEGVPVVMGSRDARLRTRVPRPSTLEARLSSLVPRSSFTESNRGSNSWVVGAARTASGAPLLANDPHLPLGVPSIWYLAVVHAPAIDAAGVTIPGVPGIVIGRNRDIAWGMTASYVDDVDEVEEEFSSDTSLVRRLHGWAPVSTVPETLRVKDRPDIPYARRRTSNGPVVRWLGGTPVHGVSRRWSGQDVTPAGLLASLRLMKARDWSSFRMALAAVRAPALGLTYADVAGHSGYQLAGGVPLRAEAHGGSSGPGWTTDSAWHGYVDFAALPAALDAAPYVVTSNNRIVGPGYRHFLSSAWASPYRAERIGAMLAADSSVTLADAAAMQMDVVSRFAIRARHVAAQAALEVGDTAAATSLERWDGAMRTSQAVPTLFWRWYTGLRTELHSLPATRPAALAAEHQWILTDTIHAADGSTIALDSLSRRAMRGALADPRSGWKWGRAHRLLQHHPLGDVPILGRLLRLDVGPVPAPGGDYTVDLCTSGGDRIPFTCTEGPSMRFLSEMVEGGPGYFILPTGQSGNPLSTHYRDQFPLWQAGRLARLELTGSGQDASPVLRLVPGR